MQINAVPVLVAIKDGKVDGTIIGLKEKNILNGFVEDLIKKYLAQGSSSDTPQSLKHP